MTVNASASLDDAVDLTERELEDLLEHTACTARVEIYTHAITEVEDAAAKAFLADDMKVATALRTLAKDFRLKLDPLTHRLRAHIQKATAAANARRNARNEPHTT